MIKMKHNKCMNINKEWKKECNEYLKELQKFLDKAENIEDKELKRDIIIQMLKCDEVLTKIAEKEFEKYYEQGKKCQNK